MAKVLLVEDDNNLREIYQARLQAEGYEIITAKDGEEALVVAKAQKPNLVISDVMMPKISGFEMLDILRNTEGLQDVKIIMLTALGQSDDQQRADKLGADRYLVKSQVTLEDIVKTAHDLLGDATAAAAPPPPAAPPPAPPAPVAAPVSPPSANPAVPPAPAPAVTDSSTTSNDNAQTTAQEEADVEASIENFVAGATTEAPAPDTPSPATNVEPEAAPEPSAPPSLEALEATTSPAATPPETTLADVSTAGSKKVIQPLDAEPQKDINVLLAAEEAKEAANKPAEPPVAVVSSDKAGATIQPITSDTPTAPAPAPASQPDDQSADQNTSQTDDPNSIAL